MTIPPHSRRVAVVGLRGIPGIMGGVETHCEELLPRVAARDPGLEITVFGRAPYLPEGKQQFGAIGVVPVAAPRNQSLEAIVSTFASLIAARRLGARLVHIHAIGPGLLAPMARLLGLRVIVTHHGTDYDRAKWGFVAKTMLRAGEWASLYAADRVICVAPSLTRQLAERFPAQREKLQYIPNGAPAFGPDEADATDHLTGFGLVPGSYILAVGRLVPEKGFDYLVDAHRRSGSDRMLVIVGAADHPTDFSRGLLATEDARTRFLGRQGRAAVRQLYENAGLFVLPSFHEGLPIVALEAARCNAPILLSDIEPNRNVGLPERNYFPVGNVDALAEALVRPFEHYQVDSAAVSAQFDWDDIAARTVALYRELL